MIPSPERLQETQLGALGVPSRGLIYWYNATNVRKWDNSYDRVVHTNNTTTRHRDSLATSYTASSYVTLCHTWCHYASTTGLALLLRIRRPRAVQMIRPVSRFLCYLIWQIQYRFWLIETTRSSTNVQTAPSDTNWFFIFLFHTDSFLDFQDISNRMSTMYR